MSKNQDTADGKRHKITYDGYPIYVFISDQAKEIFISSVNDQIPKTGSIYDMTTRFISMAWQHEEKAAIVDQLMKASRSEKDLPGILAKLLVE